MMLTVNFFRHGNPSLFVRKLDIHVTTCSKNAIQNHIRMK